VTPDTQEITALAHRHGIAITGEIEVNDIGLDFRAAFGADEDGRAWVLRIPRRPDVLPRAENEAKVLRLLKGRLPVAVPDWHVFTPELITYPLLPGKTVITVDPVTKQPTWNIDRDSPVFARSFGQALAALHGIPASVVAGLKVSSADDVRRTAADEIDRVRREVGVRRARTE
jgi:macrolide phosphotransferase